jgi:hypothetical protein
MNKNRTKNLQEYVPVVFRKRATPKFKEESLNLKNHLSRQEKEVVRQLLQIPAGGVFNEIILNTITENKADKVRLVFQMIKEQADGRHRSQMEEVIGAEALNAVLKLFY